MGLPPTPVFRRALTPEAAAPRPAGDVSFADLVRMLAESIADAQLALDRTSAEMLTELADAKVMVTPTITERIAKDGTVTYEHGKAEERSLLDLGLTPTFYQFSQATVEVTMDLRVVETVDSVEKEKRKVGLFAGTHEVQTDRTFNRDMKATSRLTATLVPVPRPVRIDPAQRRVVEE